MRMGPLEKETAMRLFEGMEVKQDTQGISVRYLTVVPFFQVRSCELCQLDDYANKSSRCADADFWQMQKLSARNQASSLHHMFSG